VSGNGLSKRTRCAHCHQSIRRSPTEVTFTSASGKMRTTRWYSVFLCAACENAAEFAFVTPDSAPIGDVEPPRADSAWSSTRKKVTHRWQLSPWNHLPDELEPWMSVSSSS